ncbi:putative transcription factor SBP family [Helianthus annuus]|uniref:Putative squamosa promoter binding protein-like 8 n=1 Tax=Helianthus annuus TaxID=4232 RepID=A0A251RU90_HELAN|nr:squamosa promoter-binding-like protein 8 [Helianthus annuus]KAF5756730.1 putative transcription factor SBP family [Helianthus annuus]KAJ0430192.1 putative transcription factor SBP family [Helianthus annuus]KAJ0448618.1 putative transcription factor SBP family [Helianthus annuus]KAJ0633498.1 putative transcription factor SBP family [Helianthus annuus]KAJ0827655.1 putative transcription factor SBP family [Helianthus annuus]
MLDYEWGMLNGAVSVTAVDEPASQSDQTRHIFDHYSQTFNDTNNSHYLNPNDFIHQTHNPTHHYLHNHPTQTHPHFSSMYDPRAYAGECGYQHSPTPLLSLEPESGGSQPAYMLLPKTEPAACAIDFANNRIGLNLGGRTYFSSAEDDFVNRLYRRSRPLEAALVSSPRCQAEGCNADLTNAKHYHRRHKVCEFHSKASTVITAGLTQRFCQQCSRFHLLSEFDNGKRSCRKRLADHNRRRRKSSQNQDHSKSFVTATSTQSSSSEIISRYQADSRV